MSIQRIAIKALKPNQPFRFVGESSVWYAEHITSEGGMTVLTYRAPGERLRSRVARPSLSTVEV